MMKIFALMIPLILFSVGGCGWTYEPVVGIGPVIEQERVIIRPSAPYYSDSQHQRREHEQWRREHDRWNSRHHEWHERNKHPEHYDRERYTHDNNVRAWDHEHDRWHLRHPEP